MFKEYFNGDEAHSTSFIVIFAFMSSWVADRKFQIDLLSYTKTQIQKQKYKQFNIIRFRMLFTISMYDWTEVAYMRYVLSWQNKYLSDRVRLFETWNFIYFVFYLLFFFLHFFHTGYQFWNADAELNGRLEKTSNS